MFYTMLSDMADLRFTLISRAMAFDLIQKYAAVSLVQAGILRCELALRWIMQWMLADCLKPR